MIVRKGVKSSGKIIIFTAISPYFFFIVLLVRAIFLDGAIEGISYLFEPKWEKLFGF
jgi:SNF family Na+-dependent transporter